MVDFDGLVDAAGDPDKASVLLVAEIKALAAVIVTLAGPGEEFRAILAANSAEWLQAYVMEAGAIVDEAMAAGEPEGRSH